MPNVNRKATKDEIAHARAVIEEAFPGLRAIFGAQGDFGGHLRRAITPLPFGCKTRTASFARTSSGSCQLGWED